MENNQISNSKEEDINFDEELFLAPNTFYAFDTIKGLIKNLDTQVSKNMTGILAEAFSSLNSSGSTYKQIENFWKSKSFLQKMVQMKDVYETYNKEFQSVYVGKNSNAKMLYHLILNFEKMGLVQKRDDYRKNFVAQEALANPAFGVVTGGRPEGLRNSLNTYIKNFKQFHHQVDIFVSDESQDSAMQEQNFQVISEVEKSFNVKVNYTNRKTRQNLVDIETDSKKKEAKKFLLFGVEGLGQTYGLNRNTLHFQTKGFRLLSVDDDTLGNTFLSKSYHDGLSINSDKLHDVEIQSSRVEAKSKLNSVEVDILNSHMQVTGQSLKKIIYDRLSLKNSKLEGLKHLRWPLILQEKSKVLISMSSLVGDSGSGASLGFLYTHGKEEERFFENLNQFHTLSKSREITKTCDHLVVAPEGPCMTTFYSYDNSQDLLPFFPHFRMEDDLFKTFSLAIHSESKLGYLPLTLEHSPIENRVISKIVAPIDAYVSNYDIINTVVKSVSPRIGHYIGKDTKKKKILLEGCLNFLYQDLNQYKKQISEYILSQKFMGISSKLQNLTLRKRKIPKDIYDIVNDSINQTELILSQPMPLADFELFKIEKDILKAEELQRQIIIKYFESCLELN